MWIRIDCKEHSNCINDPLYQYRGWIIWKQKHNSISGTYVYFRSALYQVTTVQTTVLFVHMKQTVVTCHGTADNIQYKPTPTLHSVLWCTHPEQDSCYIQVRHSSQYVKLVAKQTLLPKTYFTIRLPCSWYFNFWHTQPNINYWITNQIDSYKNK